ncbi:DUF4270 domain-containing protein [Flavobacterium sp. HXWNR69]|uniref:DUF4270 domain-containing protein n=1 Tax=Flavobacterium fragile TaxID=2949085 RepID=A0ABT0TF93_9FLAO|nr:DUF4270 domain-containing protein [Flavobacterium sp. HXWNR69]MCL9769645.1 DUF4270 domain-containing protein [Flavobacterium sp. HXWNR69]
MKKSFLKIASLAFLFVLLISCDKDFNSIDSDVIGDDNIDLSVREVQNLVAFTQKTEAVQSNNLPINALGIYHNPKFGLTKAHFVSQVELGNENPSFGYNPVIDSVYLYVPYFVDSRFTTETNGERIYSLDSIYGDPETGKFRLKVVENGYYIRDFDPTDNLQTAQKYYSDEKSTLIDPFKGSELLNDSDNPAQNNQFFFNKKELYIYKTNGSGQYVGADGQVLADQNDIALRVIKERKAPGIWLDLKESFFQQKILNATASGNLFNNNIFKNYFRGLLFEVEEIAPNQGALAMLDFSKAELKILYKSSAEPTTENPNPARSRKEFSLKLGYSASTSLRNNTINLLEHTISPAYQAGIDAAGTERLFIKGGSNGSVAYIDLFGNGELETLRNEVATQNWLINDAKLSFYVDQSDPNGMSNVPAAIEPKRIYIYDATNNIVLLDYTFDASTATKIKNNKLVFGGILETETTGDKKGIKYTVRLTEHIKRILKVDSDGNYADNVRLGISITEFINISSSTTYINRLTNQQGQLPLASVINPLGTILYSNHPNVPNDKKLKLKIYYTKPN